MYKLANKTMKNKSKKIIPIAIISIVIIAILAVILFFVFNQQSIVGSDCNLGSWHLKSYDSSTKTLIIDGTVSNPRDFQGCFGTYDVSRKGVDSVLTNQLDCEEAGFDWLTEPNGDGAWCILRDPNWIGDRHIEIVDGKCSGTDKLGIRQDFPYVCNFDDGVRLSCPEWSQSLRASYSCTADIYVINGECFSGKEKCEGTKYFACENNYWVDRGEVLNKCGFVCQNGIKEYQTCSEGFTPDKFIKRECVNNAWVDKNEQCACSDNSICQSGYQCKNSTCEKKAEILKYVLISISAIIILVFVGFIIYAIVRSRRK